MAWEILTREHPFEKKYEFMSDLEEDVIRGVRPEIPEECPETYRVMLE
jgi:hypothetical protein